MNLTTLAKVKSHLGISGTSKDAVLSQIITGVSGFIENHTHREFSVKQYTEVRDGCGEDEIFVAQYPLREVISLHIDTREIDLDAEEESGRTIITRDTGSIFRKDRFSYGRRNIKIVYEAGFNSPEDADESGVDDESGDAGEDLPRDLEAAAIRMSARVYERRTAEGVSSVSPGSFSVQYKDAVDADITGVLDSYIKRRL